MLSLAEKLKQRAELYNTVRRFFYKRDVLEVETPLMWSTSIPDPNIPSIEAHFQHARETHYLQTSPEFFMKRLLAEGSGSIFQITKAFRDDASGRMHRPEFSMLEWYRLGFDHFQLMDEMDALLIEILGCEKAERISYRDLFLRELHVDPLIADEKTLLKVLASQGIELSAALQLSDVDTYLDLLMTHCLEKNIGQSRPCFIYDYPASQAALARLKKEDRRVAERFEVYYKGVELANGFHELNNSIQQRKRFEHYLFEREQLGLPKMPIDSDFIDCLDHLPDCAGVALGLDRLLVLRLGLSDLASIHPFNKLD